MSCNHIAFRNYGKDCYGKVGKPCHIDTVGSPDTCGENERCVQSTTLNSTAKCECLRGFNVVSGECVVISTTAAASTDSTDHINEPESSGSSVAVGLLVPTFLLLFGGLGFCIIRRYRLLPCRRNLYGNVLVTREEDDDDDPPIA
ncbi:uncharacterized protein LOC107040354 isoform X2 [Diachasma alloeum]|uniref:uncharacterized protein LOC107040354 isoform X2 n=1 Tax=Diachasma alloeum TaxID=454923 RepID=UPI000738249B|nr:uncharacterized protein LOC107040354 isoform X2 [Diachasma alloeum]